MSFSLGLAPATVSLELKPGSPASKAYELTNNTNSAQIVELKVLQWTPKGFDGSVKFLEDSGPFRFELTNANSPDKKTLRLPPATKSQAVVGIYHPKDIQSGDYYYTVFFQQKNDPRLDENQTQSSGQIGSHLLLHVQGAPAFKTAQVLDFNLKTLQDNFFFKSNPSFLVKNTSHKFFRFTGILEISKNGKVIKTLYFSGDNILSGHSRSLRCVNDPNDKEPQIVPCYQNFTTPGVYTYAIKPTEGITLTGITVRNQYVLPISSFILLFITLFFLSVFSRFLKLDKVKAKPHI